MQKNELMELSKHISMILKYAARVSFYSRKMQYYTSTNNTTSLLEEISNVMELFVSCMDEINGEAPFTSMQDILSLFQVLLDTQEKKDYVLLADYIEGSLIPLFFECQKRILTDMEPACDIEQLARNLRALLHKKDPTILSFLRDRGYLSDSSMVFCDLSEQSCQNRYKKLREKGYVVEYASSGDFTLRIPDGKESFYLHTNNDVQQESLFMAEEWVIQGKNDYLFYGLGLAYPYLSLLDIEEAAQVTIIESNPDILEISLLFAPLDELLAHTDVHLILDTGQAEYISQKTACLKESAAFFIHAPSLHGILTYEYREQIENVFMQEASVRTQRFRLQSNFYRNQKVICSNIHQISNRFQGKDIYIVAAGPSLDKNIEQLSEVGCEGIILATGTVAKKMLSQKIIPDFLLITDAGEGTLPQIQGIETCGIPLLFLSTVYFRVPETYQGDKYMIYQKGVPYAEQKAAQENIPCFDTGGSVATTAFDIGMRMNCRRVIFLGLDLAYQNGKNHATGTNERINIDASHGKYVEGIDGTKVQTARNFDVYRIWLEENLQKWRKKGCHIPVIDATEGGAKKRGMQIMSLSEAIHQGKSL